jgi:type II secretory pathway component PulF
MDGHSPISGAPADRLPPLEAGDLAIEVADLTRAGLPLDAGLLALADEMPSGRAARALRGLARQLAAGVSLDAAIEAQGARLPAHLRGIITAGLRSGRLPEVLEEYVDLQRSERELRRRIATALAYPAVLMGALAVMAVAFHLLVIKNMTKVYAEFGTKLPAATELLLTVSPWIVWIVGGIAVLVVVVWLARPLVARIAWIGWLLRLVPGIGPIWWWSEQTRLCRLMGLLLEEQVRLGEALRLTADTLSNAYLATGCRQVAADVESGWLFYESLGAHRQFPRSLVLLVMWGQERSTLPDAFRAAAETFDGRAEAHSDLFEVMLPPVAFLSITFFIGFVILALYMPLLSLIQRLSG